MTAAVANKKRTGIIKLFIDGAVKGYNISTLSMCPNVVMAFVIIKFLDVSGGMDLISNLFEPIMRVFFLPGEACVVLVASFMSIAGGCAMVAGMAAKGVFTAAEVCQMLPAIFLLGAQLQYIGRCLGTAGENPKYFPHHVLISVIVGLFSLWIMKPVCAILL